MSNAANTLLSKANMEMEMAIMEDLFAYQRVKMMIENGEAEYITYRTNGHHNIKAYANY